MPPSAVKPYIVRFTIDYSIVVDAASEEEAIEIANKIPLEVGERWDKSYSQFDAEEE